VIRPSGDVDAWVRLPVSPQARRQHLHLPALREARLIVCPSARLTSLAEPIRCPVDQVAACCRERREIEPGFRDIRQAMRVNGAVLRSKRPELVRQEVRGLLIAYNLLRWEMHKPPHELDVPPARLSFQGFMCVIVAELRFAPAGNTWHLPPTPGATSTTSSRLSVAIATTAIVSAGSRTPIP
jgi:hypothetical protein